MLVSVLDYVDYAAENYPNKIAFVEGEYSITFSEFRQRILDRTSGILRQMKQEHIQHRPIVLMQQKGIDELISFMAVAWTGNIYVPFDTEAPNERLIKMIDLLDPIMIIADEKNYARTKEVSGNIDVYLSSHLDDNEVIDVCLLSQTRKKNY